MRAERFRCFYRRTSLLFVPQSPPPLRGAPSRREPLSIIMFKNGSSGTSTPTGKMGIFRFGNIRKCILYRYDIGQSGTPVPTIKKMIADGCTATTDVAGGASPSPTATFVPRDVAALGRLSRLSLLPWRRCRGTRWMRLFELYLIYFYLIRLDLRIKARSIHLL